jgi:hypothetical protein
MPPDGAPARIDAAGLGGLIGLVKPGTTATFTGPDASHPRGED